MSMMIRSGNAALAQLAYAQGGFGEDGAFVVGQLGGATPLGGVLCSLGSDYVVHVAPDGSGRSVCRGLDITSPLGQGKAWYIKDRESGQVFSPVFNPVCEKSDEYEAGYQPGQVSFYSLKNKIASTLTITTLPKHSCEVWRVRLDNRSARERRLSFTTYVEPSVGPGLETKYVAEHRALLMRRSLGSVDHEEPAPDLVLFHSSTLVPSRFVTEKSEFVGEAGTLRSPRFLSDDQQVGGDGPAEEAVASMTVEIDLPIEGEAEFGFCFGAAASAEEAFEVARGLSNVRAVNTAIDGSLARWQELCATVQVRTQDRGFDALVNAWLPYEAYAGWVGNRTAGVCLDPAWAADALRSLYALSATAPELCRDSLLSFASGISVVGAYSPDSESHIALPPEEMLWLAAAAAKYVVETGDTSVLAEKIVTREGISLTLKEHCERVIGLCVNGGAANRLVDDTVKAWLLACGDAAGRDRLDEGMAWRRNVERKEHPEVRSLPRRVNHLMSVSSALSDQPISNAIHNRFDSDDAVSESGEACRLHSALVDDVLGIRATGDGLVLRPDIPRSWCEVDIVRRYRGDTYSIRIRRPVAPTKEGMSIVVDGEPVMGDTLPYFGDGAEHEVEVILS